MTTDDFLYELGSGTVLPELDDQLRGARVGDILAFEAELPDGPVQLKVLVKDVKEKVLPEVTDEWAVRGVGVRHRRRSCGPTSASGSS